MEHIIGFYSKSVKMTDDFNQLLSNGSIIKNVNTYTSITSFDEEVSIHVVDMDLIIESNKGIRKLYTDFREKGQMLIPLIRMEYNEALMEIQKISNIQILTYPFKPGLNNFFITMFSILDHTIMTTEHDLIINRLNETTLSFIFQEVYSHMLKGKPFIFKNMGFIKETRFKCYEASGDLKTLTDLHNNYQGIFKCCFIHNNVLVFLIFDELMLHYRIDEVVNKYNLKLTEITDKIKNTLTEPSFVFEELHAFDLIKREVLKDLHKTPSLESFFTTCHITKQEISKVFPSQSEFSKFLTTLKAYYAIEDYLNSDLSIEAAADKYDLSDATVQKIAKRILSCTLKIAKNKHIPFKNTFIEDFKKEKGLSPS